jgi:hypothetical protein
MRLDQSNAHLELRRTERRLALAPLACTQTHGCRSGPSYNRNTGIQARLGRVAASCW